MKPNIKEIAKGQGKEKDVRKSEGREGERGERGERGQAGTLYH